MILCSMVVRYDDYTRSMVMGHIAKQLHHLASAVAVESCRGPSARMRLG